MYWSEWERCIHDNDDDCRICINSKHNRKCGEYVRRRAEEPFDINNKYTLRDLKGEYLHHIDNAHITPVVWDRKLELIVAEMGTRLNQRSGANRTKTARIFQISGAHHCILIFYSIHWKNKWFSIPPTLYIVPIVILVVLIIVGALLGQACVRICPTILMESRSNFVNPPAKNLPYKVRVCKIESLLILLPMIAWELKCVLKRLKWTRDVKPISGWTRFCGPELLCRLMDVFWLTEILNLTNIEIDHL